jgi:DNA replication protein DnaC
MSDPCKPVLSGWRARLAAHSHTADAEPEPVGVDAQEAAQEARSAALAAWEERVPPLYRDARATHPAVLHWASLYAADARSCPSLMLSGPTGSGKTHLAYGALRAVAESGTKAYAWRSTNLADLFGALRSRPFPQAEAHLAALRDAPLLLLDDLGTGHLTDWTEEVVYRLINGRYERCLPTLLTSNYPLSSLGPITGERVASRMAEMVGQMQVAILGADRRRVSTRHDSQPPLAQS